MKPSYIIVEDEQWELRGLQVRVTRLLQGFQLLGTAMNGREGLELARRVRPDIVISDIRMPEMDGISLAEALQREQPDCAVIIVSGFSEFEYARQAIRYGVCGYLLKPMEDAELVQALLDAAREHSLRAAARPAVVEPEETVRHVDRLMLEIRDHVHQNYAGDVTVKSIAKQFAMDVSSLSKQFKRVVGVNLSDYIAWRRLEAARALLLDTHLSNAEVGELAGFRDSSYFYRAFRRAYGKPPGQYRESETNSKE